uniref:BUD13 homolog n=2 Tax=Varanus komodoensis TaxID=61221 RepID=A0A8D2Q2P9_VARKO
MEEFRTSNKWKLLGDQNEGFRGPDRSVTAKSASSLEITKQMEMKSSLIKRGRRDSPDLSPPRKGRRDSPDLSPPRKGRRDSPVLPPERLHSATGKNDTRSSSGGRQEPSADKNAAHRRQQAAPGAPAKKQPCPGAPSPQRCQRHDSESDSDSPSSRRSARAASRSDRSPPRSVHSAGLRRSPSSDLSPPRRNRRTSSDSDSSPPRRGQEVPKMPPTPRTSPALAPPSWAADSKGRHRNHRDPQMLSGGKAGLVSAELLRKEQQASRKQDGGGGSKQLEAESRHAETIFRDKSGRKRDLKQERLEQQKKAEEKSERDEQYAKWGKGLAQSRQQQQNVEDAVKEMQKPLARYIDDQDLDKMLREQEREGDPMADFLRKKKAKERKDAKDRPKYSGPAPPLNRFNIWPGYRWDGVDRSNGFEQKRFARIASKKAVQELAYKWSVEDM